MISIIIPTLNEEKILARTLAVFRGLDANKYQVIVSDGGSTDKTHEIAKEYGAELVVATPGVRQTIAQGRNLGVSLAKGEYLVFLDADVTIPDVENFFRKAISVFEKDPRITGLTVYIKIFKEYATFADKFFFSIVNVIYYVCNNLLQIGAASGEFQMVRHETFKMIGGFNEKLVVSEDMDFFERVNKAGKTRIEPSLYILHTSRRAHSIGWPRLLGLWFMNTITVKFFKRSYSKEWKVIR